MNRLAALRLVALCAATVALPPGVRAELIAPSATLDEQKAVTDQVDPARQIYARGVEALKAGHLDDAEKAFAEAAQTNHLMPQPLVGLADVAQRRGNLPEAKKYLDQAIALAPSDDGVHYALAVFQAQSKDYAGVEVELKKVIELNPKLLRARIDLADLYANTLRRPSDAITVYRALLAIDSQHAGAHHGLAAALAATGQFTEAEAEFRKSADLAPAVPLPLHSLARMQLARGDKQAAMASLDAALKRQPQFVPALLDKGDILLAEGKRDEAQALYEQAIASDATNPAGYFKRGVVLQMNRKAAEAKQAYLKAIELDGEFSMAYNNLAWMQLDSGTDLDQALQWAATAVKLAPDVAAYRDTQGWAYRTQRRFSEAETVLKKAATMKPPVADIQYHLGMVYLDQKKLDQARNAFNEALAIDPKHAESKAALRKLAE